MEPGGGTGERLEMVAAKAGNYTLVVVVVVLVVVVVDEIDFRVAQIASLCSVYYLGVFPALLYGAPTLSSGRCCEPNSPPVEAILVVFSRDPFVDIVCEQKMLVINYSIQLVISNEAE